MFGCESMSDRICKANLDSADLESDLITQAHVFPRDLEHPFHAAVRAAMLSTPQILCSECFIVLATIHSH